jgi:hypothetical protein
MYISKNLLYRLLWLCQYISQILAQATILPTATSLGIEQDIPEWSYHENIEKMYTTPIRSLDKHNILSLQTSLTKMLCAKVLTELNLIFIVYLYSQCLLIFYYVYQTNSTNQTWHLDKTQRQQRIRSNHLPHDPHVASGHPILPPSSKHLHPQHKRNLQKPLQKELRVCGRRGVPVPWTRRRQRL